MKSLTLRRAAKRSVTLVPVVLFAAGSLFLWSAAARSGGAGNFLFQEGDLRAKNSYLREKLAALPAPEFREAVESLAAMDEPGALDAWRAVLETAGPDTKKEVWDKYRQVQQRLIRNEMVPQVARVRATPDSIARAARPPGLDFNVWASAGDETIVAAPPYLIDRLRRENIPADVLYDSIAEWQTALVAGDPSARQIAPGYISDPGSSTQARIAVIDLSAKGRPAAGYSDWLGDRENILMRNGSTIAYLDLFASDGSAEQIRSHVEERYARRGVRLKGFYTFEEFSAVAPDLFPGRSFAPGRGRQRAEGDVGAALAEGRFHSYEETLAEFKQIASARPDIARYVKLGTSYEGREIFALKITRNAEVDDPNKPDVLITGLHHAREWISVEPPVYFANQLINNYATDDSIRSLVDHLQIWIVPIVNPDGLSYSLGATNDSSDLQRLWRKNRRPISINNCVSGVGVDLNRNYNFQWRLRGDQPCSDYCSSDKSCINDDMGASDDPANIEIYRGPQAESEPEVKALKSLMDDPGRNFRAQIDYHNFSQLILYPWAHQTFEPPDAGTLSMLTGRMSSEIRKVNGRTYRAEQAIDLYATTGSSSDYAYGVNKVAAPFVVEMRPVCCDFNVSESEIDEVNRENWAGARVILNWAAGPPILESVRAYSIGTDGTFSKLVYSGRWVDPTDPSMSARQLVIDEDFPGIEPGPLMVRLEFSKPMNALASPRVTLGRDAQANELRIVSGAGQGWQKTVYENDTWVGETVVVQDSNQSDSWRLSVTATDTAGFSLDAKPETIAAYATGTGRWGDYEDSISEGAEGGADTIHVLSPTLQGDVAGVFVASPLGGERLIGGDGLTVTWTVPKQMGLKPIEQALLLSTDGGASYERIVEALAGDVEKYRMTLPQASTTRARIRVIAAVNDIGGLLMGDSHTDFTIGANVGGGIDVRFISSEKVGGDWADTPGEESQSASGASRLVVNVEITNKGATAIANPFLRVGDITRGNVLLSRDPKSSPAAGAHQTVETGDDNLLSPGETVRARLVVGLVSKKKFNLGIEFYGVAVEGHIIPSSPFYVWRGKPKSL
jgi:carboxypeptidase T